MKVIVEGHPNYPTKKEAFTSSKTKAMRQANSFKSLVFGANPTIDDRPIWPFFGKLAFATMFSPSLPAPFAFPIFYGRKKSQKLVV